MKNAYYNDGISINYFESITFKNFGIFFTVEKSGCVMEKCSSAPYNPNPDTFSSRKFIHWQDTAFVFEA